MGTFRARKPWNIIPGLVRINFSGSKTRGKKARGGASVTFHVGKWVGWNAKTGRVTVNTPGIGSWQSDPHRPGRAARAAKKAASKSAASPRRTRVDPGVEQDAQLWAQHFADIRAQGGEDAAYQAGKAAGRCPTHGMILPPGSWCRTCAQSAAKRHEQADAQPRGYGGGMRSAHARPAPAPPRPSPGVWDGEYASLSPEEKGKRLKAAGYCGSRTREGGHCLNRGNCPHHRPSRVRA